MTITYHKNVIQGSEEWHKLRCGVLTASKMSQLLTPTLKIVDNDDSRSLVFETMLERLSGYVDPEFQSFDMMRGNEEEVWARQLYSEKYEPVEEMGFVTNDKLGFVLGWSPDGLLNNRRGAIESKSRKNYIHIKNIMGKEIPKSDVIQVQSGIFIGELEFMDYNSISNGLNMWTVRVEKDPEIQDAIITAAKKFEERVQELTAQYMDILQSNARIIPIERREYNFNQEITV